MELAGTRTVPADADGYLQVYRFAVEQAPSRRIWAVEGTGSYGVGLTTHLLEHGEWVVELDRPGRPARRNGAKTDTLTRSEPPPRHLAASTWPSHASATTGRSAHCEAFSAQVETNPCFPADVINLNGDIQIVVSTTADGSGGYHVVDQVSSKLKGVSITTGTKYANNANQTDEWTAQPPFPVIHTHTYDFLLISKSNVPNYVLHMAMHETIDANGVPTVVVDNFYMDCQG